MANEFKARNGFIAQNNSVVTGSLTVTNGITGSFTGSLTGSLFGTASYASTYAPVFPFTGSAIITGSLIITGSVGSTRGFTGSLQGTSSWAQSSSQALTASFAPNYVLNSATSSFVLNSQTSSFVTNSRTSSFATTGSNVFRGDQIISGSFTVFTGSAIELQVTDTGVRIGNAITDIHNVTGSLRVSDSITGSLFGTASYVTGSIFTSTNPALSSSFALTASYALSGVGGTPITFVNANPGGGSYSNLATLYVSGSGVTISNPSAGIVSMSIAGVPAGSGTTFAAGNVDNRLITATGNSPGELNGEANLTFDGSALILSGSLTVFTGSVVELQVTDTGVKIGNTITDTHTVTGSLNISGSLLVNGSAPGGGITAEEAIAYSLIFG